MHNLWLYKALSSTTENGVIEKTEPGSSQRCARKQKEATGCCKASSDWRKREKKNSCASV